MTKRPSQSRHRAGLILDARQIRALRSPVRQAILDTTQALGRCSVSDLAAELDRPADGLYYHVKELLAVGLLVEAGERGEAARREALYKTMAPRRGLRLAYDPADPENVEAVVGAVSGMLRLTERGFAAAFQPGASVEDGPRRSLWAARLEGWLAPADLEEVNALLQQLRTVFDRPRSERSTLHAFTFVLLPMTPRPHRRRLRAAAASDGV